MISLLIISIIILILLNVLFAYSLKRSNKEGKNENNFVNISVVIAAKNEAENIDGLVSCLKSLDYPEEMFEVIFIDDNSSDGTFDILKSKMNALKNYSVFELRTIERKGKREALNFGINISRNQFLLITDADCKPQSGWLKVFADKFSAGFDMLIGVAPFHQNKKLINKISCFENLRNSLLSFSMASLGLPYTSAARNFGFTKTAFESIGGYSGTKDTLSGDDDLLLREAVKHKMKIGLVSEPNSFVYSDTKKTLKEYLQQRARHTQTSLHYLTKHQLMLGFWHFLNLLFLFSPVLMIIYPILGLLLPAKLISDLATIKFNQHKFGYRFNSFEIIYLQIFYEVFLIIHFINASLFKIKWK